MGACQIDPLRFLNKSLKSYGGTPFAVLAGGMPFAVRAGMPFAVPAGSHARCPSWWSGFAPPHPPEVS